MKCLSCLCVFVPILRLNWKEERHDNICNPTTYSVGKKPNNNRISSFSHLTTYFSKLSGSFAGGHTSSVLLPHLQGAEGRGAISHLRLLPGSGPGGLFTSILSRHRDLDAKDESNGPWYSRENWNVNKLLWAPPLGKNSFGRVVHPREEPVLTRKALLWMTFRITTWIFIFCFWRDKITVILKSVWLG